MIRWLPKKFSTRTLFVVVALVAFALVAWREWTQWSNAHYRYDRALAAWASFVNQTPDVLAATDALYSAELNTIWMPDSTARRRHAERLNYLADWAEARATMSMGSSEEAKQL